MTKPIVRLYLLVMVLIGILVFATSWWTVFGAKGLRDNPRNRRELLEQAIQSGVRVLACGGGIVLDPFIGSGTTAMVARNLGRRAVGIDLNPEYLEIAKRRIGGQLSLGVCA